VIGDQFSKITLRERKAGIHAVIGYLGDMDQRENKQPVDWIEWRDLNRRAYALQGWPAHETKKYWEQGMTPVQAAETAATRRRKTS